MGVSSSITLLFPLLCAVFYTVYTQVVSFYSAGQIGFLLRVVVVSGLVVNCNLQLQLCCWSDVAASTTVLLNATTVTVVAGPVGGNSGTNPWCYS